MYPTNVITLPTKAEVFYKNVLRLLNKANARYLIGGSLALAHYMHLPRRPKDLDVFLKRDDCDFVLSVLEKHGYKTEVIHPHWLAKAYKEQYFIDFIFSSGNGIAQVDDEWFQHAQQTKLLGSDVLICAPEEILWSKAFIMDRERFDGADIAHLIRDAAGNINWDRLVVRFGNDWPVLLTHLLLFQYIYPSDASLVPTEVLKELLARAHDSAAASTNDKRVCKGTLLSRDQYLCDVELHGYDDGRVAPLGRLSDADIAEYTAAIRADQQSKHRQSMGEPLRDNDAA